MALSQADPPIMTGPWIDRWVLLLGSVGRWHGPQATPPQGMEAKAPILLGRTLRDGGGNARPPVYQLNDPWTIRQPPAKGALVCALRAADLQVVSVSPFERDRIHAPVIGHHC